MEKTVDIGLDRDRLRLPAWAWLVAALAGAVAYGVTLENGAVLQGAASALHELFHDGRHFLGVPCH